MCECKNTVVFSFDTRSSRVNAYQIHEWLHDTALICEEDVRVIQIDEPLRKVYMKFVSPKKMMNTLQQLQGDIQFHHENGDISSVKVEIAGVSECPLSPQKLPKHRSKTPCQYMETSNKYKIRYGRKLIDLDSKLE